MPPMEKPNTKTIVLRLPESKRKLITNAARDAGLTPQNLIYAVLSGRIVPISGDGFRNLEDGITKTIEPLDLPPVQPGNPALRKGEKEGE